MREILYTSDPEDRVGLRCFAEQDGVTCTRRGGHSDNTVTVKKFEDERMVTVTFDHRGQKNGRWYTW